MKLWRISNYADLKGQGGLKAGGRWHNKGAVIVYLAEHPAAAILEILVHFDTSPEELPANFQLLEVDVDNTLQVSQLSKDILPENWIDNTPLSKSSGDQWLTSQSTVLLKVPSAITPKSFNYLFNPRHVDANKVKIVSAQRYPFDRRLLR
jgi:RES domain-containing protein